MSAARVLFFGYHSIGARSLAALVASGVQVCGVVTHRDASDEAAWFESVADLARHNDLAVYMPASPNTAGMLRVFGSLEADLFISVYYRRLLSPEVLALPGIAAVNLHGSLLPRYRGRAPLNWAIVNGERETGVTLHHMSREADAGDIIAQAAVPIGPDDTALVVYRRMIGAAEKVLMDMVPLIVSGAAPRRSQDHRAATVFGRRRPEDGRMDWDWPASRIHNLVRAVTHPYPGAFTTWMGKRLFVWETRRGEGGERGIPGTILDVQGEDIAVQTGDGRLLIRSLQMEGQREISGAAFLKQGGAQLGGILGK